MPTALPRSVSALFVSALFVLARAAVPSAPAVPSALAVVAAPAVVAAVPGATVPAASSPPAPGSPAPGSPAIDAPATDSPATDAAATGSPAAGSPTTSRAAGPADGRCRAVIYVALRWAGGYQGVVTLTNSGASPMYAWYVAWELPPGSQLGEVWNGIAMVSGPTAMIHAPSWHSPLLPGGTASAGFLASGDPPTDPPAVQCG